MKKRHPDYPARVTDLRAAPGELALVQAFVNTVDREHGSDELSSPRGLAEWLAGRVLGEAPDLGAADLDRAIEAREALRMALLVNTGAEATEEIVARLHRAASGAAVAIRIGPGMGARLEGGVGGVAGALGRLFSIMVVAQIEERWPRLKACANPACRAAFYDFSPNRSGRWCMMRRCGTRIHSKRNQRRLRREKARR